MAGLVFLRSNDLPKIVEFYCNRIEMTKWLSQPDIEILQHENFLIGFHNQSKIDKAGLLTFFYETMEDVDHMYNRLKDIAVSEPRINKKYKIYNFFARDPEGRKLEFQAFLHNLHPLDVGWLSS
ncbi:MAG: VOC family protein [Candidatus Kariarchaeaceae archaeon]